MLINCDKEYEQTMVMMLQKLSKENDVDGFVVSVAHKNGDISVAFNNMSPADLFAAAGNIQARAIRMLAEIEEAGEDGEDS